MRYGQKTAQNFVINPVKDSGNLSETEMVII